MKSESFDLLRTHRIKGPLITQQVEILLANLRTKSGISNSQKLRGKMILVPQFNFVSEPRRGFPKVKTNMRISDLRSKAVVAFSPTA